MHRSVSQVSNKFTQNTTSFSSNIAQSSLHNKGLYSFASDWLYKAFYEIVKPWRTWCFLKINAQSERSEGINILRNTIGLTGLTILHHG